MSKNPTWHDINFQSDMLHSFFLLSFLQMGRNVSRYFANSSITFTHISFRDETLAHGFEISVLLFGYTLNSVV